MIFVPCVAAVFGLLTAVCAQASTSCNPTLSSSCPPDAAFGTDYTFDFSTAPAARLWQQTGPGTTYNPQVGAAFSINKLGDAPAVRTNFTFFFGRTEVHLKAARGQGIVTSIILLSDDLDRIDFEFLGAHPNAVTTNVVGKGVQDQSLGEGYVVVADLQDDYHNYTTVWTADRLQWYLDGVLLRTLTPAQISHGSSYPQTPMTLSIAVWAYSDPTLPKDTIAQAGGLVDFSHGPYTTYVRTAQVTDYSSGKEYSWQDLSGSWRSIYVTPGTSDALDAIQHGILTLADEQKILSPTTNASSTIVPTTPQVQPSSSGPSLSDQWNELPLKTKIVIYASAGGVGGILILLISWCCIRQRRAGARLDKEAEAKHAAERAEDERVRKTGLNLDSNVASLSEYDVQKIQPPDGRHSYILSPGYREPSMDVNPPQAWDPVRPGSSGHRSVLSPHHSVGSHGSRSSESTDINLDNLSSNGALVIRSPPPGSRRDMLPPSPLSPYARSLSSVSMQNSPRVRPPSHLFTPFPPSASPQRSASSPVAQVRTPSQHFQQYDWQQTERSQHERQPYEDYRTRSPAPLTASNRSYSTPRPAAYVNSGYRTSDYGSHHGHGYHTGGSQDYLNGRT